jgi:hypothetical protein
MNHHDVDRAVKKWDSLSEDQREVVKETMRNWRSWGSWFSWGSPVGLGLFFVSVGVLLVLLHVAGLIGR